MLVIKQSMVPIDFNSITFPTIQNILFCVQHTGLDWHEGE